MTTTYLAYFPSPPQGVWHLGAVPIRAYAVFIIIGIVVALLVGDRRWEARGGERGVIYDIALWAVPFGLIGGRLYHLSTDWRTYFGSGGAGLGAALRIWDGGLGIWGAVALGGVGAWIACRRRGIPLPAFGDAVAPGIVLAQAIGRLGNYFNQELFGRETAMPWGLEIFYRRDPSGFVDVHSLDGVSTGQLAQVVQPTFLYEMLWNLLIFVVLIYLDRRFVIGHGRLFAVYVAGYCVGRFTIELLRDDAATHIAGIRINSFTSTFVFIGAVVYIVLAPKGREDPATLRGAEKADEPLAVPDPAAELAAVAAATSPTKSLGGQTETQPVESADPVPTVEAAELPPVAKKFDADQEPVQKEPESEVLGEAVVGETQVEAPDAEEAPKPEAIGDAEEPEPEAVGEAVVGETGTEELDTEDAPESEAVDEAVVDGTQVEEPETEEEPELDAVDEAVVDGTQVEEPETEEEPEVAAADEAAMPDGEEAPESEAIGDAEVAEPEAVGEAVVGETEVEAPDAEETPEPEAVVGETETEEPEVEEEPELAAADEALAPDARDEPEPEVAEPEEKEPSDAEPGPAPETVDEDAATETGDAEPEPAQPAEAPAAQEQAVTDEKTQPPADEPQSGTGAVSVDLTGVVAHSGSRRGLRRLWRRRR